MSVAKLTGKAGSFTFNTHAISFKVVNAKADRKLADTTDSADYDPATDMVHLEQAPVTLQTTLSVEGLFDLNSTQAQIIAQLYSGAAALPVIIKINAATTLLHGNFDLSDFEADEPMDDTITWKATLKSNGVVTWGA